jgi:hypothetical protein
MNVFIAIVLVTLTWTPSGAVTTDIRAFPTLRACAAAAASFNGAIKDERLMGPPALAEQGRAQCELIVSSGTDKDPV